MIRLQLTQFILRPFRSVSLHGGGEDDDESASRRDNKSVSSALTNASIKSAPSKESILSSKSNEFVHNAAGKSNKKRGVFVGLTLAAGVAAGVSVGLYYENRKTVKAEAAYLADYDGPWYYDEECLSPHERARNLKGDVKTSSVTVLINKKKDEEGWGGSGSAMPYITITSVPKPEAEPVHPEHYRKVRYLTCKL